MDGVLYPRQKSMYEYLKMHCGYIDNYDVLFTTSNFWASKNDVYRKNMTSIENLYSNFPPDMKDVELLQELSEKYDIIYITARPEAVELTTLEYLKRYNYPNPTNVIFSQDKIKDIRVAGCEWYVEDRLEFARELKKFTNVILKLQPWNRAARNEFKNVIFSLQELRSIL